MQLRPVGTPGAVMHRPSARRSPLLVLLTAALVLLLHTGAPHAHAAGAVTAPAAAAHHSAMAVPERAPAPADRTASAAAHPPSSDSAQDGTSRVCSSPAPPQTPSLGSPAVLTLLPLAAHGDSGASLAVSQPSGRGPPAVPRPVLCVWRT